MLMERFQVHPLARCLSKTRQRGSSLIEVLVTMLIAAFALLGIAGLQLSSVRSQQSANLRSIAVNQIQIMSERIRTNSSALFDPIARVNTGYLAADDYATAAALPAVPGGCASNGGSTICVTQAESAQLDIREWRQMLARELPGGRGAITPVTTNDVPPLTSLTARRVTVMWMEKAQDSDDNLGSAPTDATCPVAPLVAGVRCLSMVVTP